MNNDYSPLGLLSFLTFGLSIIAAVMAIDMYKLLRTGDFGKTWRLLIIASVMFALLQVVKLGEILNFRTSGYHLSEIVELCFVMALAYAFYQQRKVFTGQSKKTLADEADEEIEDEPQYALSGDHLEDEDGDENDEDEVHLTQWPDVSGVKAGPHSLRR